MAKSKNATTHHLGQKIHRNGIYKIKDERYLSLKGCNQRYSRNRRRAIKYDPSIKKNKSVEKRIANQRLLRKTGTKTATK